MIDQSAKKALSLQKDSIFKLLLAMMILLGWLGGIGTATFHGLHNLYTSWQLNQKSQITVFILPDDNISNRTQLEKNLTAIPEVYKISELSDETISDMLSDYFPEKLPFTPPIVLEVSVKQTLNRHQFDKTVKKLYPHAKIDDARNVLNKAARLVRLGQWGIFALAAILAVVVSLLVMMTVRAGLQAKRGALAIMQYVGATDRFITHLIVRQVFIQGIIAWGMCLILLTLSIYLILLSYAQFQVYITPYTYIFTLLWPLFIIAVSVISAWWTSRWVIARNKQNA